MDLHIIFHQVGNKHFYLKKYLIKILLFLAIIISFSFNVVEPPPTPVKWQFAFNLNENMQGGKLLQCAILRDSPSGKREIRFLTFESFILQAMGRQKSKANPDKIDYFEKYNVSWKVLDDLWKLRYARHPYSKGKKDNITGYAKNPKSPSVGQIQMLNSFGVEKFTDFFIGENAFNLLVSMQDVEWLTQYLNS